jgi:hypothetical protein
MNRAERRRRVIECDAVPQPCGTCGQPVRLRIDGRPVHLLCVVA